MNAAALSVHSHLMISTDGAPIGFAASDAADLGTLSEDISKAIDDAFWCFLLKADLEEELDWAFLRDALEQTPVLTSAMFSVGA